MKRLLALSLMLLAAMTGAGRSAVTITVNSNGGSPFATSTGALLPFGAVVRIGVFDIASPANLATVQSSNDFTALDALFTPLAEGIPNAGDVNQTGAPGTNLIINDQFASGHLFGQIVNIDASYFAVGTQLYAWVFSTDDPVLSGEWGIFTASSGWDFPASPGASTLATFEITDTLRGTDTGTQFRLSAVPEPQGVILLGAAAAWLLKRRRLRRLPFAHTA